MLKVGTHLSEVVDGHPLSSACASGSSLLLHVWSISCPACKSNMPQLQHLRNEYAGRGLQTVAVHMPRGEDEIDEVVVRTVANQIGLTEILILDNEHKIVDAFGVNAVPAYFLFDAEGKLRRHALGNFGVRMIGQAVRRLFGDDEDAPTDGAKG